MKNWNPLTWKEITVPSIGTDTGTQTMWVSEGASGEIWRISPIYAHDEEYSMSRGTTSRRGLGTRHTLGEAKAHCERLHQETLDVMERALRVWSLD